jgi:hypothetical protein
MYLVVDCETTGLPRSRAPFPNVSNRPRAVQIAWALYDAQTRLLDIECHIIRPVKFTIPHDA